MRRVKIGRAPRGSRWLAFVLIAAVGGVLAAATGSPSPANAQEPGADPTKGSHYLGEDLATQRDGHRGDRFRRAALDLPSGPASIPSPLVRGFDVSGHQRNVDWQSALRAGATFVYIKATEDDDFTSSAFRKQWAAAEDAGLYRGAYHFARPFWSDGRSQARYFLQQSGSVGTAGKILPPMVDMEFRCSSLTQEWAIEKCASLTPADNVRWLKEFVGTVEDALGIKPVIYTNPSWWSEYTDDSPEFAEFPLFIARWRDSISDGPGRLPGGWAKWTFWQHWDDAPGYQGPGELLPGSQDVFHGQLEELAHLVRGEETVPGPAPAPVPEPVPAPVPAPSPSPSPDPVSDDPLPSPQQATVAGGQSEDVRAPARPRSRHLATTGATAVGVEWALVPILGGIGACIVGYRGRGSRSVSPCPSRKTPDVRQL